MGWKRLVGSLKNMKTVDVIWFEYEPDPGSVIHENMIYCTVSDKENLDKLKYLDKKEGIFLITSDMNLYIDEITNVTILRYTEEFVELALNFNYDKGGCWCKNKSDLTKEMI